MACKYNNSMYTLNIPEDEEYDELDIQENIQKPEDDLDYSFADQEAKELAYFKKLVAEFDLKVQESEG